MLFTFQNSNKVSGVYVIECTGNDKLYIGSSQNLSRKGAKII